MLSRGFTGPQSWAGTVNTNPELTGALSNLSDLLANGNRPPAFLIPIYMEAGKRYHVPWEVLAAINSIETNYGRNLNTSSAGAIGWMQFMPATWHQWGVAIDGHSVANPYDPRDASLLRRAVPAGQRRRHQRARRDLLLQPRELVRQRGAEPGAGDRRRGPLLRHAHEA